MQPVVKMKKRRSLLFLCADLCLDVTVRIVSRIQSTMYSALGTEQNGTSYRNAFNFNLMSFSINAHINRFFFHILLFTFGIFIYNRND